MLLTLTVGNATSGTLLQSLQGPIGVDNARVIVTSLAFVTSFLTYILTSVATRKVHIRLERRAFGVALALILSLPLAVADLILPLPLLGISDFFLKLAVIIWTTGLIMLLWLLRSILSVDRLNFKKPQVSFPSAASKTPVGATKTPSSFSFRSFQDVDGKRISKFGLSCVDEKFQAATKNKHQLYFPILLVADKYFRPWRTTARFAVAGLVETSDEGVIYFAFNQPASIVTNQLARYFDDIIDPKEEHKDDDGWFAKQVSNKFERVVVIDCHSKWLERKGSRPEDIVSRYDVVRHQFKLLNSDPRDPLDLGRQYDKAAKFLLKEGARSLRVVYDSISDFLLYSDPQLAVQFLKHSVVWEDEVSASSLYLYIPEVPSSEGGSPVDESFLRWNSYCVIELREKEEDKLIAGSKIRGMMILEGLQPGRTVEIVEGDDKGDFQIITSQAASTGKNGLGKT